MLNFELEITFYKQFKLLTSVTVKKKYQLLLIIKINCKSNAANSSYNLFNAKFHQVIAKMEMNLICTFVFDKCNK